ncbi:MAG TPA: glycosyl hydrolase family 28 protein [Acidobacteriaceae bacterium]
MRRLGWVILLAVGVGCAQDTRVVKEPVIPRVCATLRAELVAPHGIQAADEARPDTARLQEGIDRCGKGKALELAADGARDAFLSGPLELRAGVTLLVDKGVTLYGSRNPADYAVSPGGCGVVNDARAGCRPLIHGEDAAGAGIMGVGTIDGRGGAKLLVDGKEQAKSWWDLAEEARSGGHQQVPRLIVFDRSDNVTIYRIRLKNSANFHVTYSHGDGFTVWGLKIDTPRRARNTDGVDPGGSKNITVTHSYIRAGDDNIAIKGGESGVTNMTVAHNHFYWGHGMSIGSETYGGVSAIRVTDLSLDGDDNALRIKSNPTRGGLVKDVVYDDICIRDSKNPILLDTAYSYPGKGKDLFPVYKDIVFRDVRIAGGGKIQFAGLDTGHRVEVRPDGVMLTDGLANYRIVAQHVDVAMGPGPVNFDVSGEDVKVSGKAGDGSLASCAAKFVPFPEE